MVKVVLLLNRKPDLAQEEFIDYWLQRHAPLVTKVPGVRRYVISIASKAVAGLPQPDGMAELWFADAEAMEHAFRSPEWVAARQDGNNFRVNSIAFVTDEHVIKKY